jgi:methionyl-tRNA synthetase
MKIVKSHQSRYTNMYGILGAEALGVLSGDLPFDSRVCLVKPKQSAELHNHYEDECFFIYTGKGIVKIDEEEFFVESGDFIFLESFKSHKITNSFEEDLRFLTLWWKDLSKFKQNLSEGKKIQLIFSTPPTPNGDLHLGHLAGPYTAADIYKRFLKLNNIKAYHVTGRDDNQSYVNTMSNYEGITPQELADKYSDKILKTLSKNQIDIDYFYVPNQSKSYNTVVYEVFNKLYKDGFIVEKEVDSLFCNKTGSYLHESYVRGICPYCKSESDGNACEACARPNDCINLIDPKSKFGEKIQVKKTKKLYFLLSKFQSKLSDYIVEANIPTHILSMCHKMLQDGLPDICVTHFDHWGMKLPPEIKGYEDQRIYVWFEMAAGYLSSAQELSNTINILNNDWRYFYNNNDVQIIHFFGYDNSYYHTLLFPAIYMALDWNIKIPNTFVSNELLYLDGKKFSTSRRHLIWGIDMLQEIPSDYLRYYLCYIRPESDITNFTLENFYSYMTHTIQKWQDYIQIVFKNCYDYFNGNVPDTGAWTQEQRFFYNRLHNIYEQIRDSYSASNFSLQRVCKLIDSLVSEALNFSKTQSYLYDCSISENYQRTAVALELVGLKAFCIVLNPIMPDMTKNLWQSLNITQSIEWEQNLSFINVKKINSVLELIKI